MKTAKVFMQGNSQAVRLPKEFRIASDEVFIKKAGDTVVLIPKKARRWQNVRAAIAAFRGDIERRQAKNFEQRKWPR